MNTERPIEVGDRFEMRDGRDAGRIVQVDRWSVSRAKWECHVDVAPKNPETVGRRTFISGRTLLGRTFKRVSR